MRELFKDEVRALGRELGLPEAFVGRHPFPGPGLAIRIPGAITKEKCDILRLADEIYIEEIRRAGLYDDIWQAFAVLLPVKTVGVMGDGRTYDFVVGLRAVTSTDGMTADFYPFDMKFIGAVATRIINEVKGVNRVVYDVTSASRRGRLSGSEQESIQLFQFQTILTVCHLYKIPFRICALSPTRNCVGYHRYKSNLSSWKIYANPANVRI